MHPENGPEIVVAGGFDYDILDTVDTVDIYTINTDSWREGNINQYHFSSSQGIKS